MRYSSLKTAARHIFLGAILLIGPLTGQSVANTATAPSMLSAYTGDLSFDILRNDKPVGSHSVTFEPNGDTVTVRTKSKIEIDFLVFTAYRFTYTSESRWASDKMISLSARTDDDGEVTTVEAAKDGTVLRVSGSGGAYETTPPIFPTDHWHKGVIGSTEVLNTITGRIADVKIVDKGWSRVELPDGPVTARHYAYTGDLLTEVWYDGRGRWVAMRFKARDGSTIRYVCSSCGQAPSLSTK